MASFIESNRELRYVLARPVPPTTPLDQSIAITQQSMYLSNAAMISMVNFINASILVFTLIGQESPYLIFGWYAVITLFTFMGIQIWNRHRGRKTPTQTSGRFLAKAEISALLTGLLWGLPTLLFTTVGMVQTMFFLLVACGMVSGFVSMMSQMPRLAVRFVLGTSIPCFVGSLLSLGALGVGIATLVLVLVVALVLQSLRSFQQILQVLQARHEAQTARTNLVDAIEAIDDGFTIRDADGEVVMANSQFRKWQYEIDTDEAVDGSVRRLSDGTWLLHSLQPIADGRSVSIHTDVTALKLREQQLIAARREAEEANAAKGRFMSTMSHELRTPLNIIIGFSKIMSSNSRIAVGEKDMREYANSIHDAGEHLLTVINDIIEFSRVGHDRYMHEPVPLDISEQMAQAISLSARFNRVQDISGLDISISPKLGEIILDEAAFRRILMNLIGNAMKFGGTPAKIAIRAFLDGDGRPVITIRDFGPGLAKDDLERVFEPFYQCEPDRGGEFSGTGLGLPLSRELARLHGGDVTLTSRRGAGTTATIVFPAKAHLPPRVQAPQPGKPVTADILGAA